MIHTKAQREIKNNPVPKGRRRPRRATDFLHPGGQHWMLCVWKQGSKGGSRQRQSRKRQKKICAQALGMAWGLV